MTSGDFAATRWSLVLRARVGEDPAARAALSDLCRLYWYPLYAFARRSGRCHHEAEDLTQGLFANLIRRESLAGADPARGRFRSFLLGAMKHHMADEHAKSMTEKRGGGGTLVPLDAAEGEARYASEPAAAAAPDTMYDCHWANEILQRTLRDLGAEYAAAGRQALFDELRAHIAGAMQPAECAEVARRLAVSEGHLRVLIHRLRRRFAERLRQQVADTVGAEADVDDELRHLIACVSG
jgi:RNA polymerase sigma factor (sigma-70 family)